MYIGKNCKSMSKKVIHYTSEDCDLVDYGIKKKDLPEDFEYTNPNILYRFFSFAFYHALAKPLVALFMRIRYGAKIKNKKVLKKFKNEGIFFYGNHTSGVIDAMQPNRLRRRKNYIIVSRDATSVFGLKNVVLMLGGMPVANTLNLQKKFLLAIDECIESKKSITIYPAATIWPYYTQIRPFKSASFSYPVRLNAPSFSLTTTYQKRWIRKRPKVTTFVDGPFYADLSLPLKEAKEKLRDDIFHKMKERAEKYSTYSYYEYIKDVESFQ